MGTRSLTIIMDGNSELCRIYRQLDGYPKGHGVALAKLCDVRITNGISGDGKGTANGMGCLAAQVVMGLKDACKFKHRPSGVGDIYLEAPGGELNAWCEYIYVVRGSEGNKPTIECTTQTGPWPFNVQASAGHVFTGLPQAWLAKYAKAKTDA